jgi:phosphoribosylanthranilate isomerase
MNPIRIKFCGLTRLEDVRAAMALGADALGFNLARGPRKLPLERAVELARELPPFVVSVAVFADADEATIEAAMSAGRFQAAQLHGDEPPELAERLRKRFPVLKAFSVADAAALERVRAYPADAYLLDAPGGGSGKSWNYELLRGVDLGHPLVLAGGLTPETVGAAVATARPWGVDVASGIESSPGIKDRARMKAFVAEVRAADPSRA